MTRVTAIDFETANASPASICAIGISVWEDGAVEQVYESLIRPEANVNYFLAGNIRVHGIHPEDVKNAPDWPAVYAEIKPWLEDTLLCAHNAAFDIRCLKEACRNCGIPIPHLAYFDTVTLSRRVFPQLSHHRLNDMCEYLRVELDHHHAGSDSYGCLMIFASIMNLAEIYDPEELLRQCRVPVKQL